MLGGGFAAAILLGWLIFVSRRPPEPDEAACIVLSGLVSKDVDASLRFVPADELEQMGLDRLGARRLMQDVILPKFGNVHATQPAKSHLFSPGVVGQCVMPVTIGGKRQLNLAISVQRGDDAPVCNFRSLLFLGWYVDYLGTHPTLGEDKLQALDWGLEEDAARLRLYGLKAISSKNSGQAYSLAEFQKMIRATLVARGAEPDQR